LGLQFTYSLIQNLDRRDRTRGWKKYLGPGIAECKKVRHREEKIKRGERDVRIVSVDNLFTREGGAKAGMQD